MDPEPREEGIKPDQSEAKDELIELHAKGDVVLVVSGSVSGLERRFLVHSELLTIVSLYFAAFFGPVFREGRETKQGTSLQVQLKEDDTEAMGIILSLLHFKTKDEYKNIEPRILALVARESNKYGCTMALWPWIFRWLHDTPKPSTAEEHGCLLVATYLFGATDHWKAISTRAIKQLAPGFRTSWSGQEVLSLLPQHIEDAIEEQIFLTLDLLHIEIQNIEGVLQSDTAAYNRIPCSVATAEDSSPVVLGNAAPVETRTPMQPFAQHRQELLSILIS